MKMNKIRNFSIIAHIDHGKSTLADRLLEFTHTLDSRAMREQVLDSMDLERERGITIKSHAIRMDYKAKDGVTYQFNLIDTPGHVDFTYEVSRSLAACEGALLIVDASQGIQAQTLSNVFLALDNDLTIIPVMNKLDLPAARPEEVAEEIMDLLGVEREEILAVSAKTGEGVEAVLEAIVERVPAPTGDPEAPLKALIFDSTFDQYRGAVPLIRVVEGTIRKDMQVKLFASGGKYDIDEVGVLKLKWMPVNELSCGEVGYMVASIKKLSDAKVGDTVTDVNRPAGTPLPGYKEVKPMVFAAMFPVDSGEYDELKDALEKLKLNDASLTYQPESSMALGFGFRCGFLGLLHMEIIQERLHREYDVNILATVPNVSYNVFMTNGETIMNLSNPSALPDRVKIEYLEEPIVEVRVFVPATYMGAIMELCKERRGDYKEMKYLDQVKVEIIYNMPLGEILFDFYDRLKSVSRGYASYDYEFKEYRRSDLIRLDVLVNSEPVDALSAIMHRSKARPFGVKLIEKLKELIPRQQFEVVLQAAIGGQIIAREVVRPLRKNVTAKCYGGDITRKRKLLEKQREGKKKMKQVGSVEIPQEAFLAVLKLD